MKVQLKDLQKFDRFLSLCLGEETNIEYSADMWQILEGWGDNPISEDLECTYFEDSTSDDETVYIWEHRSSDILGIKITQGHEDITFDIEAKDGTKYAHWLSNITRTDVLSQTELCRTMTEVTYEVIERDPTVVLVKLKLLGVPKEFTVVVPKDATYALEYLS